MKVKNVVKKKSVHKKTSIGQGRNSKFGEKTSKKRYRKKYRGQGK